MCKFFSLVSDGSGKPMYFDAEIRKKILKGKLEYELDSHTSIADYFGYKAEKEDKLNKYEYNPLLKTFQIDQLNTIDDSEQIKKFCNELDFKTIVPELNLHPIINPFKDFSVIEVTKEDLLLLKKWASVRDSVWDSVWDSVRDSVWASVWASVGASVWASVGASVRDSVWASVWASVRDSVRAYVSTYFDIKYKYDFKSCIKLWNKGIVPSFDGKIWRLHGKNGKVIWEGKIKDIKFPMVKK